MSIRAIQAVWDCSHTKGADRLVLLGIADYLNDHSGTWAFSVPDLAHKAGYASPRFVQRILGRLVELGELIVVPHAKRYSEYYIPILDGEEGYAPRECFERDQHVCNGRHTPLSVSRETAARQAIQARRRAAREASPGVNDRPPETPPGVNDRPPIAPGVNDRPPRGERLTTPRVNDRPPQGERLTTHVYKDDRTHTVDIPPLTPRAGARDPLDTETETAEAEQSAANGTTEGEGLAAEPDEAVAAGKRAAFAARLDELRGAGLVPPAEPPGGWRPASLDHLNRWRASTFGRAMIASRGENPDTWQTSKLWTIYRRWVADLSAVRAASAPAVIDAS